MYTRFHTFMKWFNSDFCFPKVNIGIAINTNRGTAQFLKGAIFSYCL